MDFVQGESLGVRIGGSGSNVSVLINDGSGVFGTHTESATPSDHPVVAKAELPGSPHGKKIAESSTLSI